MRVAVICPGGLGPREGGDMTGFANSMVSRITVLGTGYLGTTHAACLAELGFEVLGLDTDPARIDALTCGELPFYEPGRWTQTAGARRAGPAGLWAAQARPVRRGALPLRLRRYGLTAA